MDASRRTFLGLLGLAPLAPLLPKAEEPEKYYFFKPDKIPWYATASGSDLDLCVEVLERKLNILEMMPCLNGGPKTIYVSRCFWKRYQRALWWEVHGSWAWSDGKIPPPDYTKRLFYKGYEVVIGWECCPQPKPVDTIYNADAKTLALYKKLKAEKEKELWDAMIRGWDQTVLDLYNGS